jgi:DNA (cytosine-5)-methyltransferase 1
MNHASLFTGIGGFDLAAEWMGWQNTFQVEIDEWCQKLLKQNFPNAERYKDVKEFRGGQYAGTIDVLSGGFPCQPYSTAGKRKGKNDDRHLWPSMLRIIREVSPRWVVGENVRGLTNWNGGLVFDEVQFELEAAGYEVIPFLLPACAVNAPHRRDRIWFVAYSHRNRQLGDKTAEERQQSVNGRPPLGRVEGSVLCGDASDTHGDQRPERRVYSKKSKTSEPYISPCAAWANGRTWEIFPTQSPICRGNDGIPYRVDRIKGLGNAVVPQVVHQIFKAIEQYENYQQ